MELDDIDLEPADLGWADPDWCPSLLELDDIDLEPADLGWADPDWCPSLRELRDVLYPGIQHREREDQAGYLARRLEDRGEIAIWYYTSGNLPPVQVDDTNSNDSYVKRHNIKSWGYSVEPDRPWTWTKLLLPPTPVHSQCPSCPSNATRSEQIVQEFLQVVYNNIQDICNGAIKDANTGDNMSHIIKAFGSVWPDHYREAEPYSQILPAMLDALLQKWAQQRPDEKIDGGFDQGTQRRRIPLHFCSALGFEGLGEVYLQMGQDPNTLAYPDGQSALHLAAAGGHTGMMELLFDRDVDIEKRTLLTGRTALQLAASRGLEETVKLLLGEGADVDAKDKLGHTALALATSNGHKKVANLLKVFDAGEMAFLGGWEREEVSVDGGDSFLHTQLNDQDSVEVHMADRTLPLYKCPLGEECTSWPSPVSRHQDYLRHIHEKHPILETMSNDCGKQQQRFWFCCKCGDGPKCCEDQIRCYDCRGPARSNEVDEGWIAVDHQKCAHTRCPSCHENRHAV